MVRRNARRRDGGGSLSRRTALALIGGGGLLAVGASGAFDAVSGKRPFQVGIGGDDEALLRLRTTEATPPAQESFRDRQVEFDVTDGDTVKLIRIENFVDNQITFDDVSVTTTHQDLSFTVDQPPTSLAFGEHTVLEATVECDGDVTNVPFTIKISATGSVGRISLRREAFMTCSAAVPPGDPICPPFEVPFIRGGGSPGATHALGDAPPADMTTETGTVSVVRTAENVLEVGIEMDPVDGETMEEFRVDVQTNPKDFPNGLGHYHVVESFDTAQTSTNATIDLEAELGVAADKPIYLAVHASLQNDSAWAKGPFQGQAWRMYLDECANE